MILSKFQQPSTYQQGVDQMTFVMQNEILNNQHMNVFINTLMTFNVHQSNDQIREHIKILRVAAEIFEESLVPFIPKILTNLAKQITNDKNGKL